MSYVRWKDLIASSMVCRRLSFISGDPQLWDKYSSTDKKILSKADFRMKVRILDDVMMAFFIVLLSILLISRARRTKLLL